MVNYQNGKIYKLVCDETGFTYYGSTTQTLSKRLADHKGRYNGCMTKYMINPKIYLVEDYPCDRKEQLLQRERDFIENNECCNKCLPIITIEKKEYYIKYRKDNLEMRKKYEKEYGIKNREEISKKNKEYYINNLDRFKKYNQDNKEIIQKKAKIYYDKTAEERKKYSSEFHKNNREKILERAKLNLHNCECGSTIRKDKLKRHILTKKHQKFIS